MSAASLPALEVIASIAMPEGVMLILPAKRPEETAEEWLGRCVMVRGIGTCDGSEVKP